MCSIDCWSHAVERHSGYSEADLLDCVSDLVSLHCKAPTNNLTAVYKKYCGEKYFAVAAREPPRMLIRPGNVM
jgi:hypothetical protein